MGQSKLYRAGQEKPAVAGIVKSGTTQGTPSAKQAGKTHAMKNRSVSHSPLANEGRHSR